MLGYIAALLVGIALGAGGGIWLYRKYGKQAEAKADALIEAAKK